MRHIWGEFSPHHLSIGGNSVYISCQSEGIQSTLVVNRREFSLHQLSVGGNSVYIGCYQKICHFATRIFASEHPHFSNNTSIFDKYLLRANCINTLSSNKPRSSVHIMVCYCGLEFQFSSVPTRSRTFLLGQHVPHSTFPTHRLLWDNTRVPE
jgi:hypothetical protein